MASKYLKQNLTELKGEIGKSAVIVGHFNMALSIADRASRQNISKYKEELDNIINKTT